MSVSSEVQGKIKEIFVNDNSHVKKDQILFKIDDLSYKIALENSLANLRKVKDYINSMKALYKQNIAELDKVKESISYFDKEYKRQLQLKKKRATSGKEVDNAKHNLDSSINQKKVIEKVIQETKAKLDNDPNLEINEYSYYSEALTEVSKSELNLEHTEIKAPFDGIIANFTLLPGKYINVGAPLFSIINSQNLWIEANFKETDLQNIRLNQDAVIEVDAYPDKKFNTKVFSITPASGSEFSLLPAENSSGNWVKVVQRVKVILKFKDSIPTNLNLLSGMSVYVKIDTKS
ncbi:HlyD family secretion protein [Candidatus Aquarickettsia rohweri]|uniref:HlyD family secretion protein n=1 Tax=Candidatus Aquarickettsia rohweri TaxID=2602574 RepID=UPI0023E8891E|nr:HlyD family secretion protein [Candidatus Aquarickettsia rohweri]